MKQEFYKTKKEIKDWLNKYEITNYNLISDKKYGYVVDVDNSVILNAKNLDWIPVKFNYVGGGLDCSNNQLTSLEFCPQKLERFLFINSNQLTNLIFCPSVVMGELNYSKNKLINLKHSPDWVGGNFDCSNNELTSLEFCSKEIYGSFNCSNNKIENLIYLPRIISHSCYFTQNEKLNELQNENSFDVLYNEHLKQVKEKENNDLLNNIDKNLNIDILNKKKIKI